MARKVTTKMKGYIPPFTIIIDEYPLFFCNSCSKYRSKDAFHDGHIKLKRRLCKLCRCRAEKQYRTKTPERKILTALRQRLYKINKYWSRAWDVNGITKLLEQYNPKKDPSCFTVIRINKGRPFLPDNAKLGTRSESYRSTIAVLK